jgi:LL-diaminopimelate aminotransferase
VLEQTGIAVTPGSSYGAQGEGYFRMSLTVSDAEVDEAVRRLSTALSTAAPEPVEAGVRGF